VLPIVPPRVAPPVLPVAPPRLAPPMLPVAPPTVWLVAPPVVAGDPYGPSPYPHGPAPYPPPPPRLTPPPTWGAPGCPADCEHPGAALYTPASPVSTDKRPRYGLMAAGISVFSALWTVSASSGLASGRYELTIPFAGPILTVVDLDRTTQASDARTFASGFLVLDAIFQTAGVAMAIVGGTTRAAVRRRAPQISPYGGGFYGRF
jgi:hypothetical protein